MFVFDEFSLFIKRRYYKSKVPTTIGILSFVAVMMIVGFLLDKQAHSMLFNFLRSAVICLASLSLASLLLIFQEYNQTKKREANKDYKTLKEELSYKQRLNVFIIILIVLVFFHVAFLDTASPIYSIVSSLMLSIIVFLLFFVRKNKYEIELEERGYKDIRDINHEFKDFDKRILEEKEED